MLEAVTLGLIQGVTEWLPVSSDGFIVLAKVNMFGSDMALDELLRYALFLHLGTLLAAVVYFRKEVAMLIGVFFTYSRADEVARKLLRFLIVSTVISGFLGYGIYRLIQEAEAVFTITGRGITLITGILLIMTALAQFLKRRQGTRGVSDLHIVDSAFLGVAQGLAVLPGVSRSGFTVALLLFRMFDDTTALRVSFLMSIPIVLAGNIALNISDFSFYTPDALAGLIASFLFGLLTIHLLLRFAEKVRFGWFVLVFGILTVVAAFF